MNQEIVINLPLEPHEVPTLRELVGWEGRRSDYPILFERCNFWAGLRDEKNELIAFGYIAGMGLQHGYMEDIIVHPQHQRKGLGQALVKKLLEEADRFGLEIVTLTYASKHTAFYSESGFVPCPGGVWRRKD
ncbi:GNAT family N-acetyltransferase [Paenibacillus sp. CGMCC 1.16610]|uniref:GNAT family N-acetyltransferase n=1 Tax=Paenibacillus anseongense TaxID=2682845 RepID=A0ABW9U4B1_9BACL|nr:MULTISPECIES: GNAT family N-acetyltransferase [Paenibacillus]MBA2938901.1 GNAT family N-acetyltransferase [Paenibacillus sp. CGMCC 1.16610]MVQ34863.1 GNAT family N-acetyltransferase [Paenibacillus anseongense]